MGPKDRDLDLERISRLLSDRGIDPRSDLARKVYELWDRADSGLLADDDETLANEVALALEALEIAKKNHYDPIIRVLCCAPEGATRSALVAAVYLYWTSWEFYMFPTDDYLMDSYRQEPHNWNYVKQYVDDRLKQLTSPNLWKEEGLTFDEPPLVLELVLKDDVIYRLDSDDQAHSQGLVEEWLRHVLESKKKQLESYYRILDDLNGRGTAGHIYTQLVNYEDQLRSDLLSGYYERRIVESKKSDFLELVKEFVQTLKQYPMRPGSPMSEYRELRESFKDKETVKVLKNFGIEAIIEGLEKYFGDFVDSPEPIRTKVDRERLRDEAKLLSDWRFNCRIDDAESAQKLARKLRDRLLERLKQEGREVDLVGS